MWGRKYRSRSGPDTAIGKGWDYSYNVWVESHPEGVVVHDGNSRADLYRQRPDGTFTRREFFREGAFNLDGTFTLVFSDTGAWNFFPLDGSATAGKISSIVDRNGNGIEFTYDAAGRLVVIHDSLDTASHDRDITVSYHGGTGQIASITDWTGRQVLYEYYQNGDAGGSAGDLKSVRAPIVVGTPSGNDFPQGKTTFYTYSKGFGDERLNHNLLTITDPKGQTYLENVYAATQNPSAPRFDRLVRQTLGDPGDIIDITYAPASSNPNGAVMRAIVNDRVGNVADYSFDELNRCVAHRQYTGRWNPDLPTSADDLLSPPPTPKLRPGDPDSFETTWAWNADSSPTKVTYPNGNLIEMVNELDLDPQASWRSRGNLRVRRRLPGSHTPAGDQTELVELFEYETGFGGCCGSNFVTRHVDARGNETLHSYDSSGNRTHTQHRIPAIVEDFEYNEFGQLTRHVLPDNGNGSRREDVYAYYGEVDGHQNGYLRDEVVDQSGFVLTTTHVYDPVGNVLQVIDPRGNDTLYTYNQMDQLVLEESRAVQLQPPASPVRYERDYFYDANDNLVRVDVQSVDEQGNVAPDPYLSTLYEYDVLNHIVRACKESGSFDVSRDPMALRLDCQGLPDDEFVSVDFTYDPSRNRILTRFGEATEGRQRHNAVRTLYDERDFVFSVTRGTENLDPSMVEPEQSTSRYDYDANGNTVLVSAGLEDGAHVTGSIFDGFDRLLTETDPMGNVRMYHYDPNGNSTEELVHGELLDVPGATGNVRLFERSHDHDPMDRLTRSETAFFDTQSQAAIGDGLSEAVFVYNDSSQLTSMTDDRGNQTTYVYDTANRLEAVTDAAGNSQQLVYDANWNVINVHRIEVSDRGDPDDLFTWDREYDELDRMVRLRDPGNHETVYEYDSRSNLVRRTDPRANVVTQVYDGLDRLVETARQLTDSGSGGGAVTGSIVTTQGWDDSSRLVSRMDGNGNTTTYAFDPLDRALSTTYADQTLYTYTHDAHHVLVSWTDSNGTAVASTYDLLDRLEGRTIAPGAGVSADTVMESYAYDGLSRLVVAQDDDSIVSRSYDSLSDITREIQNGLPVDREYDGLGNEVSCTYPSSRQIQTTFDELNRLNVVSEVAPLSLAGASSVPMLTVIGDADFDGCRIEGCSFPVFKAAPASSSAVGPGSGLDVVYEYDSDRRVTRTRHSLGGTIDDRIYTWDDAHNKTQRLDQLFGYTVDYAYDSVDRLDESVTCDTWILNTMFTRTYELDAAGNRATVGGGECAGSYFMDPSPSVRDRQVNQYTTTPCDTRSYDANGNLIRIDDGVSGQRVLTYDYRNQLVEHMHQGTGVGSTYRYDAFGRRIEKTVADGGATTVRFYYRDWQVIEERDEGSQTLATYVYGPNIDNVWVMNRDVDLDGVREAYHYHWDDQYNVMVVTQGGNPVEYYEYRDYGGPYIYDNAVAFDLVPESRIQNPYLFAGRRFDAESGFYYYRYRYLDSLSGRFVTRDPVGPWTDSVNLGNALAFVGNSPWSRLDAFGTTSVGRQPFWEFHKCMMSCQERMKVGGFCGPAAEFGLCWAECGGQDRYRDVLGRSWRPGCASDMDLEWCGGSGHLSPIPDRRRWGCITCGASNPGETSWWWKLAGLIGKGSAGPQFSPTPGPLPPPVATGR